MPRVVIFVLVALVLVLAALLAIGWVFSSRVIVPTPYSLMPEFEVLGVEASDQAQAEAGPSDPAAVALGAAGPEPADPPTPPAPTFTATLPILEAPNQHADTLAQGTYGLLWEGGHGLLGPVLERSATSVTRPVTLLAGPQPQPGAPARIDNFVYRTDPIAAFGLPYEELALAGPVGNLRAWYVPGEGRTAVLLLHGRRRGELIETLRMIPTLNALGLDVLALAYRNHDGSAASPDGLFHYGASEWQDAHVGARLLAERGADRVILYGLSMGGAVALEALERWTGELPEPIGVVLDSPLVDPYATVELGAVKAGLPLPAQLSRLALQVASWRTGVDFGGLRQAASAGSIPVPVMVIAGTLDTTVPVASVDAFTAAVRTPLTYHRLEGVEHVEAWNHDPERYAGFLRAFVAGLEVRAQAGR